MDSLIYELSQRLSRAQGKYIPLSREKLRHQKSNSLYNLPPDTNALQTRPWRNSPKYFTKVLISAVALVKMSVHSKLGGSIEVMGMLTGKIVRDMFIVMDVYSLPVEGTETRVNAQSEAYEYMVQYLDLLKEVDRQDSIVGWYHSHPGYGCWLSGIDVATQSLNQSFQDPYLAIVVDPVQTVNQSKVEIGAFRAFPVGYQKKSEEKDAEEQDYGVHSDQYYALDIKLFKGAKDGEIMDAILNKSWESALLKSSAAEAEYQRNLAGKAAELMVQDFRNPAPLVRRDLQMFNSTFEGMMGSIGPRMKDRLAAYFGRGVQNVEMQEESDEARAEVDADDDDDESEQTDMADMADVQKGTKRNLLAEDKVGIYFEAPSTRKRFATNGAVDSEVKQRMRGHQVELSKQRREASNVGHAELLRLVYRRAQNRVFGVQ